MGFIGMIMVYQAGIQTLRILPDLSLLGATYLVLLVRDLAASIGALMLATRVGAGIAAEIGSMVVTEQVDALKMSAADPIDYLIKPRFIASLVMTTCLIIWSGGMAFTTGVITSRSGLKGLFLGNTAEDVLDRLHCDLIIVKPEGFKAVLPN
jgi:phospholipid/cholesterol/gamma-HCH transport system permease protein